MKKSLFFILTIVIIFSITSALAFGFDFNFGDGDSSFSYGGEGSGSKHIPKAITLPDVFSVTLEYTESGRYHEITLERDQTGNLHYVTEDEELLFIKTGNNKYKVATGTVNGFALRNDNTYNWEYVEEQIEAFWNLIDQTDEFYLTTSSDDGEGEICGRKTYRITASLGASYSFGGFDLSAGFSEFYDIDQETGMCLNKVESESASYSAINYNDSDTDVIFTCTRFETENVNLPTLD